MVMALPLSSDSTAASRSMFFSNRLARLLRYFPRCSGVTFLHSPSKALRAAETAMSTSFSVASCTEQMTSSLEGLMTSNVLPSTALTHSLLMNLSHWLAAGQSTGREPRLRRIHLGNKVRTRSWSDVQASGLLIFARVRRLELDGQSRHDVNVLGIWKVGYGIGRGVCFAK
jgi:hypothetical protein